MKKTIKSIIAISVLFIAVSFQTAFAQGEKSAEPGKTKMDAWPEMKAYHEVMAKTFHPSEEGNLKPIKQMSSQLAKAAEVWAASTAPKEMGKVDVSSQLKELAANSASLDKMVKDGAKDDEIKANLAKLHEQFHAIVGACMKGEAKEKKAETTPETK